MAPLNPLLFAAVILPLSLVRSPLWNCANSLTVALMQHKTINKVCSSATIHIYIIALKGGIVIVAKARKVVITGQQRTDLDAGAFARVIIRLARQRWLEQTQTPKDAANSTRCRWKETS
jgi:hypothetical protein